MLSLVILSNLFSRICGVYESDRAMFITRESKSDIVLEISIGYRLPFLEFLFSYFGNRLPLRIRAFRREKVECLQLLFNTCIHPLQ